MRAENLIFALALCGCGAGKGSLELSITGSPPIPAADEVEVVTGANAMTGASIYHPSAPIAIGASPLLINLQFPANTNGTFTISVTARLRGTVVGVGTGSGSPGTGAESEVPIVLIGNPLQGDMAGSALDGTLGSDLSQPFNPGDMGDMAISPQSDISEEGDLAMAPPDLAMTTPPDLAMEMTMPPDLAMTTQPDLAMAMTMPPDLAMKTPPDLAMTIPPDLAMKTPPDLATHVCAFNNDNFNNGCLLK